MQIVGLGSLIARFHTIKAECAKGMERGLKKAGLFLQRQSQKVVPIDTGVLKGSAFTRATGSGLTTEVEVGYTQGYAIYVHENLEAQHKRGKYAKFLETPAYGFRDDMLEIIRKEAEASAAKIPGVTVSSSGGTS